jgi:short-subunit dehydrogenase
MLGVPNAAAYSATKSGLRALTFGLYEELRGSNVKIAVVSPGPIDTEFSMADLDATTDLTLSQPISTADEIADQVLALCNNSKRESAVPAISGILATVSYLFPTIGRAIRPLLESKGRRVRLKLKARARQAETES